MAADVNGDGVPDLITTNFGDDTISVLLGNVDGSFRAAAPTGIAPRNTPLVADLNGDGIADEAILDQNGDILFRAGLPGASGGFAPPVVLNAGDPASGLTVVRTPAGFALAAIDVNPDLSTPGQPVYRVTLYTIGPTGQATSTLAFTTDEFPERIVAGDLTGDGLDDLVLANPLDNSVTVAFQTPAGGFAIAHTLPVGVAPSDLVLADVDGDGRLDIVAADQASGDVTVLLNDATHPFTTVERFRAGTGLYGLDPTPTTAASLAQPVSVVAGDFTGDGRTDLVVVDQGDHSLDLLVNDGAGGFLAPEASSLTSPSDGLQVNELPGPIAAGNFRGPDARRWTSPC